MSVLFCFRYIIYTADHGFHLGEFRCAPYLLRQPVRSEGAVALQRLHSRDVTTTFLPVHPCVLLVTWHVDHMACADCFQLQNAIFQGATVRHWYVSRGLPSVHFILHARLHTTTLATSLHACLHSTAAAAASVLNRQSVYRYSCRCTDITVPMMIRGPGIRAAVTLDHMTQHIDLAPTIADLVRTAPPAAAVVDGRSMAPLFFAPSDAAARQIPWRQDVLFEYWGACVSTCWPWLD